MSERMSGAVEELHDPNLNFQVSREAIEEKLEDESSEFFPKRAKDRSTYERLLDKIQ